MNSGSAWTSAKDIEASLLKFWNTGRILAAKVGGEAIFPLHLRVRGPNSVALASRFGEAQTWVRALEAASRTGRGFGFDITWREVRHRQLGRNRVPCEIVVPTEDDGLQLIHKQADARRFETIVTATSAAFPDLVAWFARKPLPALSHAAEWPRILSVLAWFRDHPKSGLYLRQVDIPQLDTKFIEAHKGLLAELLDIVLACDSSGLAGGPALSFEARYGLRSKPATVRFRLLGAASGFLGLTDIATPVEEFARLNQNPRLVFVTENEINGLAFPPVEDAIVLFGLGYSVDLLTAVKWLHHARLIYWGDIDTHGFAMLARLRAHFPKVESILMDETTLLAHRTFWVREDRPFLGDLPHLSDAERSLFEALKDNRYGDRIRLEQERIAYSQLLTALRDRGF